MFFFEKKNQKTFTNLTSLYQAMPQPNPKPSHQGCQTRCQPSSNTTAQSWR
jgi:hypothetical protein